MYLSKKRAEREIRTVGTMIGMYCKTYHGRNDMCKACDDLARYARKRSTRCIFGSDKPVCSKCTVHCYKPVYQKRIREVMRFAGPRMIYAHPLMAIDHLAMKIRTDRRQWVD
jgi:hypothetical protein